MARVVLAMSGGVDSSVAGHLLRSAGHDVIGLFMRHGHAAAENCSDAAASPLPILPARASNKQGCCSVGDAADARRVADRLGIPFYAVNFEEHFDRIIDYFVDEYTAGRTPNPCVMCNNWLKFGKLCDYADQVGAKFVATGHYARLDRSDPADEYPVLRRGVDPGKDQSYVLFGIDRAVLSRILLPIGGHCKDEIRSIARSLGLRVAEKKDSQEICFVPDNDYAALVQRRHERRGAAADDLAGELVTVEGDVIGQHAGIHRYTIGQRKGLGVAMGEPRYVVRLEAESRRVVIGTREQLVRHEFTAGRSNWICDHGDRPFACTVQIRYSAVAVPATVTPLPEGRLHVALDVPRTGIAPGQAAVCYDGDRVLGGGWIE
jgi:tRNA-specific 2-thiouridylase